MVEQLLINVTMVTALQREGKNSYLSVCLVPMLQNCTSKHELRLKSKYTLLIPYIPRSSASRTCNGETWSGTAPGCEAVDCGDITVSSPLVADYIDTLYGYEVKI